MAAGRIVFSEDGGVLIAEAEADCDGGGTPTVSCVIEHVPGSPVAAISVVLDDLDDELVLGVPPHIFVSADGGAGPDTLDARPTAAPLVAFGSGRDDRMFAGAGSSTLVGGDDEDTMTGGPAGALTHFYMGSLPDGADVLAGGAGLDVAEYDGRLGPMTLSADGVANDGEAGEGDDIRPGVEGIQGGAAPTRSSRRGSSTRS